MNNPPRAGVMRALDPPYTRLRMKISREYVVVMMRERTSMAKSSWPGPSAQPMTAIF
jgi:hypothetical protein